MCIGFIYVNPRPSDDTFHLVLINNRDESYSRPTKPASLWNKHCISGLDLQEGKEGGMWLGVSTRGKVGMLVNVLGGRKDKMGRGSLIPAFLEGEGGMEEYVGVMEECLQNYNSFSLVLLEKQRSKDWKSVVLSNEGNARKEVQEDFIAIGNSPYEHPFLKVAATKKHFADVINKFNKLDQRQQLMVQLLKLLRDSTHHRPDEALSQASRHLSYREALTCNFVQSSSYGTRTHSIILIDSAGKGQYLEVTRTDEVQEQNTGLLEDGPLKDYIMDINRTSSSSPPSQTISSSSSPSSSSSSSFSWSPTVINFQLE